MNRLLNVIKISLAILTAAVAACSGGSSTSATSVGSSSTQPGGTGRFLVLKTEPLNNGRLFLNDPIRIDFTNMVNLASVNLNTFSFQVLNSNGIPVAEQVAGSFALDTSPGDTVPGRRLLFVPRFPTNNSYSDGGFRPGRTYLVSLISGDRINNTVIKDVGGRALASPVTFAFSTADGTTPSQLFRDRVAGGPRRTNFTINGADATGVSLNKFGGLPVELHLNFNQALNPSSNNVPVAVDLNPTVRNVNSRGRIFLEYDDPIYGNNTWIPSGVNLDSNGLTSSSVSILPIGVLPNNATIRVIVENTLEDISGESNIANAAYSRIFATFLTKRAYDPQFDALIEDFRSSESIDQDAPFLDPFAQIEQGFVKAGFEFEGTRTELEYGPNIAEVILNTDFTQVVPSNGVPFNVSGGVFNFKNVTIPNGVTVRGQGTRPMVWLVSNDFTVAGLLTVSGGGGDRVNTLNSANFPSAGGVGPCNAGNGGKGSPNSLARSMQAEAGFGAGQIPGGGGGGGLIACVVGCGRGSGGGGGSLSTQGDPFYKSLAGPGTAFQQQVGRGGQGCAGAAGSSTRNLNGGAPGPVVFTDARTDNNFFGVGINVNRQIRIRGELALPVGGEGGGGGGNNSFDNCSTTSANFINDNKGGGGGGGGGVLIVKALHDIIISPTGSIKADGGDGGGGEPAGSCGQGGGGGGGCGGMIILMAGHEIIINAKGTGANYTYQQNDYAFALSADGGVCTTGTYSAPVINIKYAPSGTAIPASFGTGTYDTASLGAFGGMGVIQLLAPPGPVSVGEVVDNTNTLLDDHIKMIKNGITTTGTEKKSLLAWRGFPDLNGTFVDDNGTATNIGANEGDIRPSPVLLPCPYGSKTRARSKWLDTGFSVRRGLTSSDTLPRGIIESSGFRNGPTYDFAGVNQATGYCSYTPTGGASVRINYPIAVSDQLVETQIDSAVDFEGQAAYSVTLVSAALGTVANRYCQYEAELLSVSGTVIGSFRILGHTDRTLFLSAADGPLPNGFTRLQVRAKFFKVVTGGSEGLGTTYVGTSGNTVVPVANVRIGFAFHKNPASPTALRFPAAAGTFVYDLENPATQEQIRSLGDSFVQWDITFDTVYKSTPTDNPPSLSPTSPRPEVHFLRIPFRF